MWRHRLRLCVFQGAPGHHLAANAVNGAQAVYWCFSKQPIVFTHPRLKPVMGLMPLQGSELGKRLSGLQEPRVGTDPRIAELGFHLEGLPPSLWRLKNTHSHTPPPIFLKL